MLIVTAKLSRRKLALWGAAVVGLLCCALLLGSHHGQPALSVESAPVNPKGIKTDADRVRFLSDYGWQVSAEPPAVEELLVPNEFDDSYREYLALQSQQGFDLTACAGKRIKRYTYQIVNYPTGETDVRVNLLIHKNTVVGGEVLSSKLDGFLHGLSMPDQ
ncbi:MAG: DUF4830 domain-containing protein [Oscillospiraceae bacterium]|nr:DUF4830 domain-containing protein [Oscillospiraceae bacterium]